MAKARVIEIYLASKLWYAANFYPIPSTLVKDIDKAFIDYIKFPREKNHVSRMEMEKLREKGGIKLINTQLKSETSKVHWLIRLITDDNLRFHRSLFNSLVGLQKGNLTGVDLIFVEPGYIQKHLALSNTFYREAFGGIAKLDTWKHVTDIHDEHLFFNRIFTTALDDGVHENTLRPFQGNQALTSINPYGDLLAAEWTPLVCKLLAAIRRKRESITQIRECPEVNSVRALSDGKEYPFNPKAYLQ